MSEVETEVVVGRKPVGKYADRVRHGKTAKDHKNGAWKQRLDNLEARADWIRETQPKHYNSVESVPKMPKPHGKSNSSKAFKLKPGKLKRS